MATVRVHNKARNITYVYESESYWAKDLKQPRSHRKLIGRLDPVTGEVIPTSRKRKEDGSSAQTHNDTNYKQLYEQALSTIEQKDAVIRELRSRLAAAESDNREYRRLVGRISGILASAPGKERDDG